ncbi:MAG TPA: cytochrome c oxidase assembly protein [Ilumatobacter sp.]|nr:cytochrome c oxidase assembly protein [Ilumatobacter sp.]
MPIDVNPWAFSPHPEVWLLVAFLTGAYVYMVRVIGPKAVARTGEPVIERRHWRAFGAAIAVLWVGSDWPLHDISEEYLYSAHMVQHMLLSYVMPPLALLATPTWLARVLVGEGRLYAAVKFLTKPVVAGLVFNFCVIMLHTPVLVNAAVDSPAAVHYLLHVVVVTSSLLMWMPVCGPLPQLRMGSAGSMIYLFLQSVVPTVPAAWLTFAESPIYEAYNRPIRLWGISVTDDQQLAGAVMKVIGGLYLWAIVIYLFFRKFAARFDESHNYRRGGAIPLAEITGHDDEPLTTADVEREFARSVPPTAD